MPIYNLNNRVYDIPDDVVKEFEKENPTATMAYQDGEDIYDIQVNQRDEFLKQFPDAKLYVEQPEEQDPFEANMERFRNGQPTQKVTTQSVIDANNQPFSVADSEINRLRGIKETAQKQIDEAGFFDRFFDADTRAAVAARNQAEEALETYEEAKHADEGWFDRNVMGVFRGIGDKIGDLATWDFGASGAFSGYALKNVSDKLERGEQLTAAEQNMLDAFGLASAVQTAYQDKVGMAYRAGGSLPESAAFMGSLALNPAAGIGRKIAERAAKAAVKKFGTSMVSKLAKGAARVGGDALEMAVATAVPGAGRIAEDYYNRVNGQSTFDIDENGIIRYGGQVEQEEADDAIWKAFGSQFIENYSESVGNYFAPMGTMLSNLTSKGLKAGGLGKLADVVNDISSSQFSRGLKRFKDATKFDGFVGEYLEEVAGNFMNAATVGDMNFNSPDDPRSVFNPEVNMETALSCALMSGTMYAVEAPVSIYNRRVAKKNLSEADKAASELWGDRWEDMRSQMDEADPQHLAQLLTGINNATDLSDEAKQAAKSYAARLMQMQGYNARRLQNQMESTDEANSINNAYDEGAELSTPYDKHNAKLAVDRAEAALGVGSENADEQQFAQMVMAGAGSPVETINAMAESGKYSDEQIQKAKDYYTAYHRMNGLTDALLDKVDSQIESAVREVDANTNKDNGSVTKVVLRDGRMGYIVGGTVVRGEKGIVDVNNSDDIVMVRLDNGEVKMMNPDKDLYAVSWIDSPENVKEGINVVLREKLIDNAIGEIDWNPATPNPKVGDSFEMEGVPVTIVSHDGKGGMFVVPTEEYQSAVGSEKKMQELVAKAQQTQPIPANEFKNWASAQLDAQEEAAKVQQEVASGESVSEQVNAGVNNSGTPNGSNVSPVEDKRPMTEDEAASFIFQMERNAVEAPEIELTPENWIAEFGEDGLVETPIGQVKFGQNQYVKLQQMGRRGKLGMIRPTLTEPDVIIEDKRPSKDGTEERDFSYVFIKAFTGKDGKRMYYFTSVTIKKDGSEVVISNQEKSLNKISRLLQGGNVVWTNSSFSSHPTTRIEESVPLNDSNKPTSTDSQSAWLGINSSELSTNKDSDKNVQSQENKAKPLHEREKEDVFRELGETYGEKMPHKVEVTAKAWAEKVAKAQKKVDEAQQKLDDAPIGEDAKPQAARDKAQQELDAIKVQADFWAAMDADIKAAQQRREDILNPQAEVEASNEPMNADEFVAQQLAAGNIVLNKDDYMRETGFGSEEANAMNGGAKKLFGANGMTIQEAGERLMEMDRENGTNFFDQSDSNAGRDALISVLGSVKSRKELNQYIAENRKAQAEKASEGLRNELEKAIMNNYHMSLEEYASFVEVEMQINPYEDVDLSAIDAIFAEAELERESLNEQEYESESETDVDGNSGQSELLSEEQAGDTAGNNPSPSDEQAEGTGNGTPGESEAAQGGSSGSRAINPLAEAERIHKEEQHRRPLRERIKEWENLLGVKVNVLESIDEVHPETRAQIEAEHANGDRVPAWVAPDGKVYFFMPDLHDMKEIDDTYVHEVVAHVGLPLLLGKKRFAEFCDKVWDIMPQSEKDYYEKEYPGVKGIGNETLRHRRAADEYIAYLAEKENLTPEEKTTWDNIVKLFREMFEKALNKILNKNEISHLDISQLIKMSYANLKSGAEGNVGRGGTRFNAKKKDSERRQKLKEYNDALDQATAFVTGWDVKRAKQTRIDREQKRKEDAAEIYESVLKGDFNDVTLQKIDKYIEDATPFNSFGQRISQRLPQGLERSLREGARTNAVDALFSRISESSVPASRRASEAGRREIEERKKEALKSWAIATGNWHTDLSEFTDEKEPFAEGTDSKVYASKEDGYVIKTSFGKPFGKRFRPDIDNVALFNRVFPNAPYEIVGYGEFDGKFARILKQPTVLFAEKTSLTEKERVEYMHTLGFEPINDSNTAFSNGTIIAADLQKSNILKDAAGNVSVIDADMKLHTKDVGGNYTYPPVEADLPEGTRFRRVYHGSGASFDKFDHSFMGTGEGNQSFGWGTYVTDSQGIGKQYAKVIGGEPVFTYKGMSKNEAYKMYPELQYLAFFMDRGDSAEEAIERRKSILNKVINTEGVDWFRKEMAEKSLEVLDSLDSSEMKMTKNRHLYEVEIPDNNGTNYLSWEEPLTEEQKERIKAALTKTDEYKSYAERYGKELSEERVDTWLSAKGGAGRVYRFLENFFEDSDNSSKAVSELFSDAGFVGMEYPANYYGGGNSYGDNNYVIFNEDDLEIVEHTRFRVTKDKNELVAVHNIFEDDLRKVLNVGGLIMPSIAITKADMGHEGYGEISLLFGKETINPSDKRNKVYGGDAWTPRFPHLKMKLNDKIVSALNKKIWGILDDRKVRDLYHLSAEIYPDNIERVLSNNGVEGYYGKEWMKLAYLLDNGKKVKIPMKMKDYGELSETILEMAKERGLKIENIINEGIDFYDNNKDFVGAIHEIEGREFLESLPEEKRDAAKRRIKDEMTYHHFDTLMSKARRMEYDLEHGGLEQIIDGQALRGTIEKKVKTSNADYNKWVDSLFDGIIEKYGIRNNRDMFTPSGNLRPWGQLYDEATPANILKHMLAENEQGGSGGFFDSNIMGASAETYDSIEKIREKGKKRLRRLEDGEYEEWSNSVAERMSEICYGFLSAKQKDDFGASIDAKIAITNAVAKDKTAKGIYKEMKREYPGFTMEHAKKVEEIVKEIQDFAIGYFEAKPRRIVPLREVRKAIVPKKTSEDILEGLKNNGIEVATYKRGDEAARARLIKRESNGIRFRVSNRNQEIFVSNAQRAVEGIKQEKATPQQWLAMIEKNGGLKAGEDKWLGLSDWLKESDKKSLTKAEILDFISQNKIVIEEVKYNEGGSVDSLRNKYPMWDEAFEIDEDDFGGVSVSLYNDKNAADIYNMANPESSVELQISSRGSDFLLAEDEERVIEWARSEVLGDNPINSTRLNYTTEGLENKEEIALVVPAIEPWNVDDEIHFGDAGEGRAVAWIRFGETTTPNVAFINAREAVNNYIAEMREKYNVRGGGIYDVMNEEEVKHLQELTSAEFDTRDKVERVLVIDEIQSKRHQEGREKGYKSNNAIAEEERLLDAVVNAQDAYDSYTRRMGDKYNGAYEDIYGTMTEAEQREVDRLEQEVYAASERYNNHQVSDIPEAPFEKNWHELAMKRMLRYAAENGFDKVAWTKGAQQADRYNLRNVVNSIAISKSSKEEGKYHLTSYDKEDLPISVASGNKTPEELAELFGKAVANELIEGVNNLEDGRDTFILEGAALEVGGEGMKGFYDKMLPSFVNKYVKKWGTKVQDVELPNVEEAGRFMHSIDVTEAMKESVMEGQTMFRVTKEKMDALNKEVADFTSEYKSKPVSIVEIGMDDKALMEAFGNKPKLEDLKSFMETSKTSAAYIQGLDKIVIFANNASPEKMKLHLYHENIHGVLYNENHSRLIAEFYEYGKDKAELVKWIEALNNEEYEKYSVPEEFLAYVVSDGMVKDDLENVLGFLSDRMKAELKGVLKKIGYDYDNRRRNVGQASRPETEGKSGVEDDADAEGKARGNREGTGKGEGGKVSPREQAERLGKLFGQVADMGLRGVVGDADYNRLMYAIFREMPQKERDEISLNAVKNLNLDVAKAVSDYLNTSENATLWEKVVGMFRDILRKAGFDVELTKGDVKYLLWRSRKPMNRKMPLDVAEDMDARRKFGATDAEGAVTRFRVMDEVNERFNRQLDEYVKEGVKANTIFQLGRPQGAMRLFLPNLPIVMRPRIINKSSHTKHDVDASALRNLPQMISEPIFVFKRSDDALGILTEIKDRNGKNVCVAIEMNKTIQDGGTMLEVNDIRSIHGREAANLVLPIVHNNTLVYADKKKGLAWLSSASYNYQQEIDKKDLDSATKIVESFENPKAGEGNVRFRVKKRHLYDSAAERPEIVKKYDKAVSTGKFNFMEAFQDRMRSLKEFMDIVVEATGKKVRDYEDAYEGENQLGSKIRPAQLEYKKKFYEPLIKELEGLSKKYGFETVRRYVYCKSGLERNVVLRQRDADEAYNEAKAELDEKLAKGSITQPQYDVLLQQAEDQRTDTLSKDVDYSGIRGMKFNIELAKIDKELEEGKIDEATHAAKVKQLESDKQNIYKDWKKFAEDQVAELEGKAEKAELDALWKKINAATNETLRIDYECGMIDKATYDAEKKMMKYYIPLRNWKNDTAEDVYHYRHDMVKPVSSNQKRARGRESEADNPVAVIALMAQNAIVRGYRNKMKLQFYAFVANRETELASVRDVWYVKDVATGDWEAKYADTSGAADAVEMKQIMEQFETDMKQLQEQGLAFKGKLPSGMNFRASKQQKDAHVVTVMIDGQEHGVYINGDPRVAEAVNGLTNSESNKHVFFAAWDKLNRLYGGGLTSWNPDFIAPNFIRDTIHSSTMMYLDKGPIEAAKYMFRTPKILSQVFLEVSGTGTGSAELHRYFEEFVENGGETGYTEIHTLEDYKKEFDKLMNEAKGIKAGIKGWTKERFGKIAKVLEAANRISEDVNRFNAYVTARRSGESIQKSVSAAKNISVNFNRKGAGFANNSVWGSIAGFMSRWILFFNPSVQGIAQLITKSKMNPKRAMAMGSTILASGLFMPMLNEMLVAACGDGDEDDYWNQSDFKRRNNWLIFTGDGYVSVPLPPVLRELYGMGDIVYGVLTGHITPERAGWDMLRQVQSAIGFVNLIPEVSQEPDMTTWMKGFGADIFGPMLDIISNTNFMGRPIAKWTDYNEYDPEYERVYKGVSPHWVELSKLLNEVGGNEGRRSSFWGNFINPAMMEHLITNYGGGIGKTINNVAGMITDYALGNEDNMDEWRKLPIVPRFYIPNDEKTVVPGINKRYYDYSYRYNNAKAALKKYEKGVQSGEHPEYKRFIDEMRENGEIRFILYFKDAEKRVKMIQNLLNGNPPNKEQLEKTLIDVKAQIAADCYEMMK